MSKDSWRFDPREDYSDRDDNFGGNRKGFQPNRKGGKFRSDKFDGKRMKRDNHRRDSWR